jgi:hypothetical protein
MQLRDDLVVGFLLAFAELPLRLAVLCSSALWSGGGVSAFLGFGGVCRREGLGGGERLRDEGEEEQKRENGGG